MKIIIKTAYFISFLFFLTSCNKWLDEKPVDRLAGETFYKTEQDAEAAVYAIYDPIHSNPYYGFRWPAQYVSMEDYSSAQGVYVPVSEYKVLPSANIAITDAAWAAMYKSINASNIVLKYVPPIVMDETKKNALLAEARFLRAFNYYNLVRGWGAVPISTEAVESIDVIGGSRRAVEEVYALIIDDLKFAETNLPVAAEMEGRPTKWSAKLMLADVYLTRENWTEARDKANEVIESGEFSLVPVTISDDFYKIFGPEVVTSSEDVFSIKFVRVPDHGTVYPNFFHAGDCSYAAAGYNTFFAFPTYPLIANWNDADLRKAFNIYTQYPTKTGGTKSNPPNQPIRFKKFIDPSAPGIYAHGTDIPICRYAEALLIYAEAESQANGGPTALALERLNMVHRRAYGYAPNVSSPVDFSLDGQTATTFRNLVLTERAYEFMLENKRWYDLKRTNTVKETIKAAKGIDVADAALLLPIPQQEINNNPNIGPEDQNPGY